MSEYRTHHFVSASSYSISVHYDKRLAPYDIAGSVAHARMLQKRGIISAKDLKSILAGLNELSNEVNSGSFPWRDDLEDVHMNIESRLHELIGEPAARLHTGRSRNDQVVTATRLLVLNAIAEVSSVVEKLQESLLNLCEANPGAIIPGYTHLQRAQPVLFAHHLLAYFEMLERDKERFADCRKRTSVLPLGSGALAGVPYDIDREQVAKELGFASISKNSMDAVSDRDYIAEFLGASAICMMHCSRLAEEIVLWTSQEFGFLQLSADWVTGSSIMPQKRNPDFAELARGKTGRVYGSLFAVLTTLKGLPLSYNRDLQEDKEGLFDSIDTLVGTVEVLAGMLSDATIDIARTTVAANDATLLATDMADYLVMQKGLPFRDAHAAISALHDLAGQMGQPINQLSLSRMQAICPAIDEAIYKITAISSIESRDSAGGTASVRVRDALTSARTRLRRSSK